MNVELAVLADAANVSQEGKLNLLGMFQSIHTLSVPCTLQASVVILLRADLGEKGAEHRITVKFLDDESKTDSSEGGNHTTYKCKVGERLLITQIVRHNKLAKGYAVDAVKLIDQVVQLRALQQQEQEEAGE